jgi:transcriptional regulator with XRE-family HTH domain
MKNKYPVCPLLRQISSNLIKIRNKYNLTQQYVADELGIERKTYAAMENGQSDIRISVIIQLSKLYHIHLSEIVYDQKDTSIQELHDLRQLLESLISKIDKTSETSTDV